MNEAPTDLEKRAAAERAAGLVEDGMLLGLGTGSTAALAVRRIGALVRETRIAVKAVPTSEATRRLAESEGIPLLECSDVSRLDLAIDGADEADRKLSLIKGGGGALLREKVVARLARKFVVIAESRKLVEKLGAFPLPVEVVPFAWKAVSQEIEALSGRPGLRLASAGTPFVTDNGNWILDCRFAGGIDDAAYLAGKLDAIPGVAEHGLFVGMASLLILGQPDGTTRLIAAS